MTIQASQYAALKAAIQASYPAAVAAQDWDTIAAALSAQAVPAYYVWQDQLTPELFDAGVLAGATQIDGLTQGKRDELFFIGGKTRNCNDPVVRAAILDACGSQNTLKSAMAAIQYRTALVVEKMLASGSGTIGLQPRYRREDQEALGHGRVR